MDYRHAVCESSVRRPPLACAQTAGILARDHRARDEQVRGGPMQPQREFDDRRSGRPAVSR